MDEVERALHLYKIDLTEALHAIDAVERVEALLPDQNTTGMEFSLKRDHTKQRLAAVDRALKKHLATIFSKPPSPSQETE